MRQPPDARSALPSGPRHLPWWTRPSTLNLLFVLPMLLLVFGAGGTDLTEMSLRARSYLSAPYIALCVGLVLISAVGAWLGENVHQHTVLQRPHEHLVRVANAVAILVLVTYLLWYRSLFLDPALLLDILTGGERPERSDIGTVVGITSLVNLAPLFFGLAGYLLFVRKVRDCTLIAFTAALLLLTFFRAYVWSERLAVAEALIPLALALLGHAPRPHHRVRRWLYRLGPYAALPAVFLFFAVAEFFRSWPYYQDRLAFWDFAFGRFVGYYYTSLNNGAGMLATGDWPDGRFESVLRWLHSFPLGIGPWFSQAVGLAEAGFAGDVFLQRYGDPEFNTASSYASVTLDLGVAGAMLYFFLGMFCAGILYTRYLRGDPLSIMLYPSVPVALFEGFRYPYWGTSRAFVWLLGALIVTAVLWTCGAARVARSPHHASR